MSAIAVLVLAFVQNVSFTIVSRSRNRNSMIYHAVASVLSNTLWFLCLRELLKAEMVLAVMPAYVTGTVVGSLVGAKVSMWIEKKIGATSDGHLK
jgi:putative flippase GtrA